MSEKLSVNQKERHWGDDLIERAKQALAGVTDGPWRVVGYGNVVLPNDRRLCKAVPRADAEFIVAARSLLPELIAELGADREEMSYDPSSVERVVEILRENADANHPLSIHLLRILGVEPYASWAQR